MKRSEALNLIANKILSINATFIGLKRPAAQLYNQADTILTALEAAGIQPPNITLEELIPGDLKVAPEADKHYYACWEPEGLNGLEITHAIIDELPEDPNDAR